MNSKRIIILLLGFIILFFQSVPACAVNKNTSPSSGSFPRPKGKAAILMDAASGRVLYEYNARSRMSPASLTKIMTGLLTVENGQLDKQITISEHAAQTGEATIYLKAGERLTRRQLLYACMLKSANDAAAALAENVGGNEHKFVDLMNHRAHELGMKDTHYSNPHGLSASHHYTSAYDLAVLSRQAMYSPQFSKVVGTKRTTIPWAGHNEERVLVNINRLLFRYPGATGVKTGYTKEAGNCLVGAAKREDMVLIAVVLNSPRVYDDMASILDYGFAHYKLTKIKDADQVSATVKVVWGVSETVKVRLSKNLAVALAPAEKVKVTYKLFPAKRVFAPVKTGQKLGVCKIYFNEREISQSDLIASYAVAKKPSPTRLPVLAGWVIGIGIVGFGLFWALPRFKK